MQTEETGETVHATFCRLSCDSTVDSLNHVRTFGWSKEERISLSIKRHEKTSLCDTSCCNWECLKMTPRSFSRGSTHWDCFVATSPKHSGRCSGAVVNHHPLQPCMHTRRECWRALWKLLAALFWVKKACLTTFTPLHHRRHRKFAVSCRDHKGVRAQVPCSVSLLVSDCRRLTAMVLPRRALRRIVSSSQTSFPVRSKCLNASFPGGRVCSPRRVCRHEWVWDPMNVRALSFECFSDDCDIHSCAAILTASCALFDLSIEDWLRNDRMVARQSLGESALAAENHLKWKFPSWLVSHYHCLIQNTLNHDLCPRRHNDRFSRKRWVDSTLTPSRTQHKLWSALPVEFHRPRPWSGEHSAHFQRSLCVVLRFYQRLWPRSLAHFLDRVARWWDTARQRSEETSPLDWQWAHRTLWVPSGVAPK